MSGAEQPEELVGAALLGGTDQEAHAIVERELAAAGIPCVLEGSAVYGVQVAARDLERAIEVLKAAGALEGHWIQFPDA